MSKFSDQLSLCVQSSGKSKNQLIELCHINRSSFYQFLNGKRLPTEQTLDTILIVLQLPPGEEEQLRTLYDIAQIGESVYENRLSCAKCLEDLSRMTLENQVAIHEFTGQTQMTVARMPVFGKERVFQELCHLIQAEMLLPEPEINLFLPQEASNVQDYLRSFFQKQKQSKIRMRQIVQFPQRQQEEKCRAVLTFFNSSLFLAASGSTGYEAHYYYADANLNDAIGVLYPYCVITSTGTMLLTARMDRALFSATDVILAACRAQFDEVFSRTKPFLCNWMNPMEDEWEQMFRYWANCAQGFQYFYAPRFGSYLTEEVMDQCVSAKFIPRLKQYLHRMRGEESFVSFCTAEGIWDFTKTGIFPECPERMIPALPPAVRRMVLEEMLYRPRPSKPIYLLNPNKLTPSREIIFAVSQHNRIFLQRQLGQGRRIYAFQEKNLLEVFEEYFQALTESDCVLPPSSLNQVLRECIRRCRELENCRQGSAI